jgi:cell division protein FtsQ
VKADGRTRWLSPKIVAGTLSGVVVLTSMLLGFHWVEQFLIRDPRFALIDPDNSLLITGAEHASRHALEEVFAEDYGHSAYLVPVGDRRMTLKTVAWVKDATVSRLWPNRLVARVVERKPVAYLASTLGAAGLRPSGLGAAGLRPSGSSRAALIDEDGVILPPTGERFALPAVVGVRVFDPLSRRRERVALLLRLLNEIGDARKDIFEVDVSDSGNLKVNVPYEGGTVTLLLGDTHFQMRYTNFRNHIAEIKRKLPGASTLDLRLEDRITVVE